MRRAVRIACLIATAAAMSACKHWPDRPPQGATTPPTAQRPEAVETIVGKRGCGTMIGYRERLRTDIDFRRRREEIERRTAEFRADNAGRGLRSGIAIIPVVVHVVYNPAVPAQNVSDALIDSQLAVLNADYRRMNSDSGSVPAAFAPLAADTRIQFQRALRDPNCQPTNGITRTSTTMSQFTRASEGVKFTSSGGHDAWPRDRYLNLWVCNIAPEGGFQILGYSSFPGDPANVDGVVLNYRFFGTGTTAPFDLGRTATHEIGHWLNLNHIWGDDALAANTCSGTDNVADTPNQDIDTTGCKPFPTTSCANGPNGDMFMNYLDYSDDNCMYMFSAGQSLRMEATLAVARAALAGSDALLPPPPGSVGGSDLFSKDAADDIGLEPNATSSLIYLSDDIWVRNQDDGVTNQEHENAQYRPPPSTDKSYVYVRVRNRGCTGTASGTVKLYWAKASTGLSWPAPWDGSVSVPAIMGNPLGAQPTGAVAAGAFTIVKFEWRPPNPADYASFGADRAHFCLLARIETDAAAPFGMSFPEIIGQLAENVRNNNNIVWKNIEVALMSGGRIASGAVIVANYTPHPMTGRLVFDSPRDGTPSPFELGTVIADLGPELYAKWRQAQTGGQGFEPLDGTRLRVTNGAVLGGIILQSGELHTITIEFQPSPNVENRTAIYAVDVHQIEVQADGVERIVGGQRFLFKTIGETTRTRPQYK